MKNYDSKKMNKRSLAATLIICLVCLVIVTGSTFSLFTDYDELNIAITSGEVKLTAEINQTSLRLYSKGVDKTAEGKFANGGTASPTNTGLNIANITPGDKAVFNIEVVNSSSVDIQYRVIWEVTTTNGADDSLKNALDATVTENDVTSQIIGSTSAWTDWNAQGTKTLEIAIELPLTAGNECQGQTVEIDFAIEAVQGNHDDPVRVNSAASLQDAIDAGSSEIILDGNIDLSESITIGNLPSSSVYSRRNAKASVPAAEMHINLNGYTITYGGTGAAIVNNSNVAITGGNISASSGVAIQNNKVAVVESVKIAGAVSSSGALTLTESSITVSGDVAAISTSGTGSVVINSGSYANTTEGGVVISGKVTVNDGEFDGQVKANDGAAPTISGGSFTEKPVEDFWVGGTNIVPNGNNGYISIPEGISGDYFIGSVAQLLEFAAKVNGGDSFSGKTVALFADIDLTDVEWTPIGQNSSFNGNFNGYNHTISNLTVNCEGKTNVGFFGYTQNGSVKNIKFNNAKVTGRLNVGVVSGQPYTSTFDNITITGHVEVNGMAYVGGALGKNAYANVSNITINVDETSYVNANSVENGKAYRTYVGGVIGFMGEGAHTVSNITSNINVIGSTIDVGGIVGIAHYGNKLENIVCSGDVTVTAAADAADADEIGGIAGVWHNENGTTVTLNNCVFTGKLSANVEGVDLSDNLLTGAAYTATGTGKLLVNGGELVYTVEALKEALAAKKNVTLGCNLTVAAGSGSYGPVGITVDGSVLDGNGYTLTVTGAGSTWGCAIYIKGGTVKNIVVAGAMRGIFTGDTNADISLNNVSFKNVVYTYNSDAGNKEYGVYATNCTFNGWTSFSNCHKEVVFTGCTFTEGSGYAFCRPYNPVVFDGCTFTEGYQLDTSYSSSIELIDCTYGESDITIENALSLTGNDKAFVSSLKNTSINGIKYVVATTLSEVMAAAKNGNVIIDAQGANLGDFSYDGTFGNGTVLKNAKFTYVYGASVDGVATFENCEFVSDHSYSANFSDGSYKGKVIFNNCYFDGWNSFGESITSVEMNNCVFETEIGPYSLLRFYQNAVLNNCEIKASFDGIDTNKAGTVVELNNCIGIEGKIYNNTDNGVVQVGKWIVNGVELTDVPAW